MTLGHGKGSVPYHLIVIFILLSVGIGIAGNFFYLEQKMHIIRDREEIEEPLRTRAALLGLVTLSS